MIKVEDEGERISTEVSGTGEEILTQLAYLIRGLKTRIPKEFIMASVETGLEFQSKEDEEEIIEEDDGKDIEDILEDIKKMIKEAIEDED